MQVKIIVLCVMSKKRPGVICFQNLHCMWLNSKAHHDLQNLNKKCNRLDVPKKLSTPVLASLMVCDMTTWVGGPTLYSISPLVATAHLIKVPTCVGALLCWLGDSPHSWLVSPSPCTSMRTLFECQVSTIWCNSETWHAMCRKEWNAQCQYASWSGCGHKLEMTRLPCHV